VIYLLFLPILQDGTFLLNDLFFIINHFIFIGFSEEIRREEDK